MAQNNLVHRLFYTSEHSPNHVFARLTGIQPSDGRLLVTEEHTQITLTCFLDARYADKQLLTDLQELQTRLQTTKTVALHKQLITRENPLRSFLPTTDAIIIEPSLPLSIVQRLKKLSITTTIDTEKRQQTKRMIKTPYEIQCMRKAISLTKTIFAQIEALIQDNTIVSLTELQLRGMMIAQAMEYGATDEAFPMIVASGSHSAIPHHRASRKQIAPGPLLVDMGRVVDGYCSDMTRTYRVGNQQTTSPEGVTYDEFHKALATVQRAHAYGCHHATNGASIATLCRDVRQQLGVLEPSFTHSLGHGVGVAVHEGPAVHATSELQLITNMAVTIEPGVYFPGKFGIRREDIVFVA